MGPGGMGRRAGSVGARVFVQTKKTRAMAAVPVHAAFWAGLLDWMRDRLGAEVVIDAEDAQLIQVIDDPKEVVTAIFAHYEKRGFQLLPAEREVMLNL